jgi:hypothetical protein
MIVAMVLAGGVKVNHFRDETIICVRCAEPFTWSYGEQAYYQKHGLHKPKHCQACRPFRREKFRSSEIDHPPYAAPLPYDVYEPPETPAWNEIETAVSPPPIKPDKPQQQLNWWDALISRYNNLLLFILVLLTLIVLWLFWQAM